MMSKQNPTSEQPEDDFDYDYDAYFEIVEEDSDDGRTRYVQKPRVPPVSSPNGNLNLEAASAADEAQPFICHPPSSQQLANSIEQALNRLDSDGWQWKKAFERELGCKVFVHAASSSGPHPLSVALVVAPNMDECEEEAYQQMLFRVHLSGVQNADGVWREVEAMTQRLFVIGSFLRDVRDLLGWAGTAQQEEVLNNLFDDCGGYLCDETGVEAFSGGTHWPFPPRREMNISCFVEVALGPWLDKVRSEVDTPANTLKRELFDVKFRLDCAPNQLLKTWSHQTHSALRGTWDYCQHEGMTSVFVYFTHTISMPPLLSGTSDLYGDTWELSLSVQLMDQDFNGASGWLQICATAVECVPVFSSTPYCPPLDSSAASLDFNVDA